MARCEPPLRIVTYNIEDFLASELQVSIARDVSVVAVKEILDPITLERAASTELGASWKIMVASDARAVAVLDDSDRGRNRCLISPKDGEYDPHS